MRVSIIIGAHAYAVIKSEEYGYSMDVLLSPGKSPADSLRITAKELQEQAEMLAQRAKRIAIAADLI